MSEENTVIDTILDRPRALRFIGLTQMLFGLFGLLGSIGLIVAAWQEQPQLADMGYVYAILLFLGVAVPCLVIGNYVDDLRRSAVIAQIFYSLASGLIAGWFLWEFGLAYQWTFPWFDFSFDVYIGNLAAGILAIESIFALYLIARWKTVAPPSDMRIERDKTKAELIERGTIPSPMETRLVGPDGKTLLSEEDGRHILNVRRVETEEGMAILCSNCGGATPIEEIQQDNTVKCNYCGVQLGVASVFVPCENHPNLLAATKCAVCGDYYCRECLTAQEPPVDEKWEGSMVFLCKKCFEGRYRPAVTTTSLVIPIDQLFGQASGRFSKIGRMYASFLKKYASAMKWVLYWGLRFAAQLGKSGGKRGGGKSDDAAAFLLVLIIIVVAVPVVVALLMLLGGIIIIPLLFYAGLIGITIEAVKIIRHTDFISLNKAREEGIRLGKPAEKKESVLRNDSRSWVNRSREKENAPAEGFFRT
ncbi:hypothetical protein EU537_04190 [Candidatus Thorarchaeota archaeon]|nr:MAG: hypothetical protein EU537_04190 [Candidatus Thorarchaeota archaeon]